jgi:predicted Zn-dependent peptidase
MNALDAVEAALATRPVPGTPRPFTFPLASRTRLSGGLSLVTVNLPGRPLISAGLVLPNGAVDEPAGEGGATVLAARALTEGTAHRDAVALTEAAERLGASLHAEAGWDATVAGVDVPAERLGAALELLAELVREPAFPQREVERLRGQRLNDLLQAKVDPARRAEEAFIETIYAPGTPYARVAGGRRETVAMLDADTLRRAYERRGDPARAALVVGGDLAGLGVGALVEPLFGDMAPSGPGSAEPARLPVVADGLERTRVRLVHRPGAVQSELRVGHMGMPRQAPDYHAVTVMAMILGGLFNSRLNRKLREEKGYTYGAGAGFDFRRHAGPFSARAAVNTDATVPALTDLLAELHRIRDAAPEEAELRAARDFLVGVFPLRFETPGPIVASLGGLVTFGLPDDELDRYRPAIDGVTGADVLAAARAHLHLERLAVVVVGDADAVGADLEKAGLGDVEVVYDPDPFAEES